MISNLANNWGLPRPIIKSHQEEKVGLAVVIVEVEVAMDVLNKRYYIEKTTNINVNNRVYIQVS